MLSTLLTAHKAVYLRTSGLLGHRLLVIPTLVLHTTGRHSAKPRASVLAYARDGADYLVVASNHGTERAPAWLHNLRADGASEIRVARRRILVTGQEIVPGDTDYDRLWQRVNKVNAGMYRRMANDTERPIPIIRLSPR